MPRVSTLTILKEKGKNNDTPIAGVQPRELTICSGVLQVDLYIATARLDKHPTTFRNTHVNLHVQK